MEKFFHIRSTKFPILEDEAEELVNEGMYGKALATYLRKQLKSHGYTVPFFVCEDWGWWVEVKREAFANGVRIYASDETNDNGPIAYACALGNASAKKWNWMRFRFDDVSDAIRQLEADLVSIFEADPEIELIGVTPEFPF